MTQDDDARKLEELDRLLNDPDVPMDPSRVWSLLAELSGRDVGTLQYSAAGAMPLGTRAMDGSAD